MEENKKLEEEIKVEEEVVIDGEVQHVVTAEDVVNNPDGELIEGETVGIPVVTEEETL